MGNCWATIGETDVLIMPNKRTEAAGRKSQARSRISNGKTLFFDSDGRTRAARRYRDVLANLSSLFGRSPNEAEGALLRRAATLVVLAERQDSLLVRSETVDPVKVCRLSGALTRVFVALDLLGKPAPAARFEEEDGKNEVAIAKNYDAMDPNELAAEYLRLVSDTKSTVG